MQYSKNDLEQIANEITTTIRSHYLDAEGILTFGYSNGKYNRERILDDFGDVAPFISKYGGEDICQRHLSYLEVNKPYKNFTHAFSFTDLVLGLVWYSRIGKYSDLSKKLAVDIAEHFRKVWMYKTIIHSSKKLSQVVPVTNGVDSTFIEVWTELYRLTGNKKYLTYAQETMVEFEIIRKKSINKLIPKNSLNIMVGKYKLCRQLKARGHTKIMKDNTNYLYGLLDLYRLNHDSSVLLVIKEITYILENKFNLKTFSNKLDKEDVVELLPSFAVIDFCCDAYVETKDAFYLNFASRIADFWIAKQADATGLMPLYSNDKKSYFDCETDMSIALSKLYEISGSHLYLQSSEKILSGIISHHKTQLGYVNWVDVTTGEQLDDGIKTKFVALLIKPLLLRIEGRSIYNNDDIFMLMKDR